MLNQLNAYICESHRLFHEGLNDEGDDAPICLTLAVFHAASGDGHFAVAGGDVESLEVSGTLLGVESDQEYQSAPFHLEHGDTLLMTTDSIVETKI